MRLIDADDLKTAFPCGESVRTECVRGTINNMPTIEPEPQWIPCSKKHAVFPCIACDSYGQVFIPCGIVHTSDHCFDGKWFNADNLDAFFSGFDVGNGIKVLPREIIAWMPLPAPYKPKEEAE